MCGLTVVAGNLWTSDTVKFKQMVVANTIRGRDATGIASIFNNSVEIHKDVTDGFDFFDRNRKKVDPSLSSMSLCLLGHNRAATRGGYDLNAAHPFQHGNIVGMHNGHILEASLKDLPDTTPFPTDSEHIIKNIALHGAEKAFRFLRGDWSVVWFDTKEKTLNFTSNGKRPLHFGLTKDNRSIYVGSEKGLLEWIINRNEYGVQTVTLGAPITAVVPDMLYSFKITNGGVKANGVTKLASGAYFFAPTVKPKEPVHPLYAPEKNLGPQKPSGPISSVPEHKKPTLTLVKKSPTETPPIKTDSVMDIPIFTEEELKDMPEASLKTLKDRILPAIQGLTARKNTALSILADINWSDKITWRKNTKNTVSTVMNLTFQRDRDLRLLRVQERRVTRQLERRNMLREANESFKKNQVVVSPPPNTSLKDYKTLADMFTSESSFSDFMSKHKAGCACCGAVNPLNFTVANSILLKDDQGFICDNCAEKPSVLQEFIIPMAMRA